MRTFASKELFLKLLNYHGRITSYLDEIVHLILFTSTIFVNKYVLSILKFTYPTVFQGWQTLVGVVILKFLIWKAKTKLEVTPLDRKGTINMLPHLLFYVGSIVAGSKALASLPIPVFLSACNLAPASVYLLDHLPGLCTLSSLFTLLPATVALISSAFVLLLCDAETSEVPLGGESPYFWMLVHVVLITAQSLHDRVADPRFSAMDRLYYANLFGLVILAPASLYLEEAFLALQFRHRRQIHFYIGCVLSGVLGLLLRMHLVAANFPKRVACNIVHFQVSSLSREKGVEEETSTCGNRCRLSCVAVAAVLASALSLVTFPRGALEVGVATSVTTSLVAALFVCPLDCSVDNSCSRGGREEEELPVGGEGREEMVKQPPAEEMQKVGEMYMV